MRFFCCCQSDQRTLCQNCAAGGFGNPSGPNASCPPGVPCGTADNGSFTFTTCLAPLGHPCCATYTFTAAGYVYPRWCKEIAGGLCEAGSVTDRNVVSYSRTRCDPNPPCDNPIVEVDCAPYRTIDSIPWSITVNKQPPQPVGNPGFCNIDGITAGAPGSVFSTTTIDGDWRHDVQVTVTWSCRVITLNISASWTLRACASTPPACGWLAIANATMSASYILSPGSGACNMDGTYIRSGSGSGSVGPITDRHLAEYIPPRFTTCDGCYELSGPMQCGFLPPHQFGWRVDTTSFLAGLPNAIQVIRT